MKAIYKITVITLFVLCLSACALKPTRPGYYYKGVRTQISNAILLFPVPKQYRKIYLKVTNKTKVASINNMRYYIVRGLKRKGYHIVNHLSQADFDVRVTVLFAGVTTLKAAQLILLRGYFGSVLPAGVGPLSRKEAAKTNYNMRPSYTLVADLAVGQRSSIVRKNEINTLHENFEWYMFHQRIVSTYSHELNPEHFDELQPAFDEAIERRVLNLF